MSSVCAICYMEKIVQECNEMGATLWNRVPPTLFDGSDNTDQMSWAADQTKFVTLNIQAPLSLSEQKLFVICYG